MGLPLARHLLQAGHTVTVYNRTRARVDLLKQLDPVIAEPPAAAARGAEVLITMVADDAPLASLLRDHYLSAVARGWQEIDWAGLARVAAADAGL